MDQLTQKSPDLSIDAERKIAKSFMGRVEWEMIAIGLGQFSLWIATWALVIIGTIPLYAGFLIALFTACNAYLPSHAGQHGHLSGGKKNLQWLDYWVGQISVIPLAQSHDILKATHLKHHAYTNDSDLDPDFFHGHAKNWWDAAVNVNVGYNDDGPAMKAIEKHQENDPKFEAALEKGGSWVFLFYFAQIIHSDSRFSAVVFAGGLNLISVMSKHVKQQKRRQKPKANLQTHQNLTSQPMVVLNNTTW